MQIRGWYLMLLLAAVGSVVSLSQVQAGVLGIGNVVFVDANGNGVFDAGEGVPGVSLQLFESGMDAYSDAPVATTTTGSGGEYLFSGLDPGTYFIYVPFDVFDVGGALESMYSLPGSDGHGSDDDGGEDGLDEFEPWIYGVFSEEVVLTTGDAPTGGDIETGFDASSDDANDGDIDLTVDLGFYRPVGVGNMVFVDRNANGHADAGEGVEGVRVQVFASGADPGVDAPVAELTTWSDGHFFFDSLYEGNYFLHIPASQFAVGGPLEGATSLSGTNPAGDDDAGEDGRDDMNPATEGISTAPFALTADASPTGSSFETGQESDVDDSLDANFDLTRDFGFTLPAGRVGVGNLVFEDLDGNHHYDSGEGVDGVTVQLFNAGDDPQSDPAVAEVITHDGGFYLFGNLAPGSYFIHIPRSEFLPGALLARCSPSSAPDGGTADDDAGQDGSATQPSDVAGVSTAVFVLGVGAAPTSGSFETGEGSWLDDYRDEDVDLTRDLGFVRAGAVGVGNLVFVDADFDGHADPGEGVSGVLVQAFRQGQDPDIDLPIGEVLTDIDGTFMIDELPPGSYFLHIPASQFGAGSPLEGRISIPGQGADDGTDDGLDENGADAVAPEVTGVSSNVFTLASLSEPVNSGTETGIGALLDDANDASIDLTIDFGFTQNCLPLAVGPVSLVDGATGLGYSQSLTATGGTGPYSWSLVSGNLPAGLSLDGSGNLVGTPNTPGVSRFMVRAVDSSGCSGTRTYVVVIDDGGSPGLGIGNLVFVDTNLDGAYSAGEGRADVLVQLFHAGDNPNTATPLAQQLTASDGIYRFSGLAAGDYFVHVPASQFGNGAALAGLKSMAGYGTDDGSDDDLAGENGRDASVPATTGVSSITVTLAVGTEPVGGGTELGVGSADDDAADGNTDLTVDLGFRTPPAAMLGVGNLVFLDANGNHHADEGEGVDGVTVELFHSGDDPSVDAPVDSAVTSGGGRYLISGMAPGSYFLHIPAAMFAVAGPLEGTVSLAGFGLDVAIDDGVDENGVDAIAPEVDGISSPTFGLDYGTEPTDASGETGLWGDSDNLLDSDMDLTKDFGFGVPCPAIAVSPSSAGPAVQAQFFSQNFSASGGTAPYAFAAIGTLPDGMTLSSGGVLSGTPVLAGNWNFTIVATDDNGCTGTVAINLEVQATVGVGNLIFLDANFNGIHDSGEGVPGVVVELYAQGAIPGVDSPVASTTTSGDGVYGFAGLPSGFYFVHVPASMFSSGALLFAARSILGTQVGDDDLGEKGIDVADPASTGVSTAVFELAENSEPTDAGTETGYLNNSDNADDDNTDLTIDLGFALYCDEMQISPGIAPSGWVGVGYSTAIQVSGGQAPYAFSAGSLPNGLTLAADGTLSGSPTDAGTTLMDVTVVDYYGCSVTESVTITILPGSAMCGVGNLVFYDLNSNGVFDPGEGVADVTVELYQILSGSPSFVGSVITDLNGTYQFDDLVPGDYEVKIPAAMFQIGGPLYGRVSIGGTSPGDDDAGEDGLDAVDPSLTGVVTNAFTLAPGVLPVDEGTETGGYNTVDNALDPFIDLTVDLGFTSSVPGTFAQWQAEHPLGGLNGPDDDPDGDRMPNVLEAALGTAPDSGVCDPGSTGFALAVNTTTKAFDASFRRRIGGMADTAMALQAWVDGAWQSLTLAPVSAIHSDGTETLTFSNLESDPALIGDTTVYVRLLVTLDTNGDNTPEATATSPVWMFHRHAIPAGQPLTLSMPLQRKDVYVGMVDQVIASTLDLSGGVGSSVELGNWLADGGAYYLEVLDGSEEGHRFEIDEQASTATSVVLDATHDRSTLGSVPGTLTGVSVAIRKHWTLSDLAVPAWFGSTNNPGTADRVLLYNHSAAKYDEYWLYANGGNPYWLKSGDATLTNQNTRVVDAMEGLFTHKRSVAGETLVVGMVRDHDAVVKLLAGTNFVGSAWPLPQSPDDRSMTTAQGFFGGTSPASADRIRAWQADTGGSGSFKGYFLLHSGPFEQWVAEGDSSLTSQNSTVIFGLFRSSFVISVGGLQTWRLGMPSLP